MLVTATAAATVVVVVVIILSTAASAAVAYLLVPKYKNPTNFSQYIFCATAYVARLSEGLQRLEVAYQSYWGDARKQVPWS